MRRWVLVAALVAVGCNAADEPSTVTDEQEPARVQEELEAEPAVPENSKARTENLARGPMSRHIDLSKCNPQAPHWERDLMAAINGGAGSIAEIHSTFDAQERASEAIAALPKNTPRYVEARCRAGMATQHAESESHLLAAIAALEDQSLDPLDRWRFLAEPSFVGEVWWNFKDWGSAPSPVLPSVYLGKRIDPEGCRTPDVAFLHFAQAYVYGAAGRRGPGEPKMRYRKPRGARFMRAGTNHIAALQQDVERELGPDHPYAATMREELLHECGPKERKRFRRRCLDEKTVFERNLKIYEKEFGRTHRATRRALLVLGIAALHARDFDDARGRFEEASAGDHDQIWVLAQEGLVGLEYAAHEEDAAFERMRHVVDETASVHGNDFWDASEPWRLYSDLAAHVGNEEESARADREADRVDETRNYVGPGGSNLAMIDVTKSSPSLRAAAIEQVIQRQTRMLAYGVSNEEERRWRTKELEVARACKKALALD